MGLATELTLRYRERMFKDKQNEAAQAMDAESVKMWKSAATACRAGAGAVEGVKQRLADKVMSVIDDFDTDPDLLNVNNGVLDLRTGNLTPHGPEHLFTYCCPTNYEQMASTIVWDSFLNQTIINQKYSEITQLYAGYSLTGHTREDAIFYLFGPARSGKSTFLETVRAALGVDSKLTGVMDYKAISGEDHDTQNFGLAPLRSARFVTAAESNRFQKVNDAKWKWLSGGDQVVASHKHKDSFRFTPHFKIWVVSNFPPRLDPDDTASWARLRVVQFPNSHVGTEDRNLRDRLKGKAVLEGVLRWMVEGAMRWYQEGLPEVTDDGSREMRDEQDSLKQFLEETTVMNPNLHITVKEFRRVYEQWCEDMGATILKSRILNDSLSKKGVRPSVVKKIGGAAERVHEGLGFKEGYGSKPELKRVLGRERIMKRLEYALRTARLRWLAEHPQVGPQEAMSELRRLGLISRVYGVRHLVIDRWYLDREGRTAGPKKQWSDATSVEDPYAKLLFAMISSAAEDFMDGRPCDLGLWTGDTAPTNGEVCRIEVERDEDGCVIRRNTVHVCSPDARRFLLEVPSDFLELVNLDRGYLEEMVRVTGSPAFRWVRMVDDLEAAEQRSVEIGDVFTVKSLAAAMLAM